MTSPTPRGPVSALVNRLIAAPGTTATAETAEIPMTASIWSDDAQLALWTAFETQYSDRVVAADGAQWDPAVVAVTRALSALLEDALRAAFADHVGALTDPGTDPGGALLAFVDETDAALGEKVLDGRSPSRFVQREATREQVLEMLVERSLFGLKESDPHAFVLPRLHGAPKAALAELLYDEFGSGRPDRVHAGLYAAAMEAAGLDPTPGAYLDAASASTFAVNNTMSLLCLDVRLAPAAAGHFAAFEATSAVPSRRLASGIERVGLPAATADYFHEHVLADSVHDQVAARDLCGGLVEHDRSVWPEVLFGAFACLYVEARAGRDQLDRWAETAPALEVPA